MTRISEPAEREIRALLTAWWVSVNQQLATLTGSTVQIGEAPVELLLASEIGQRLANIASAAEGLLDWSPETARAVIDDCQAFEAWLNGTAFAHKTPEAFWSMPVGDLVLRALVWAEQDQLITLSEAAEISGMSLSVLSQRISRGQIMGYRDPREKNPQRARRVRRSAIQQLLEDGSLRTPLTAASFGGLAAGAQTTRSHQTQTVSPTQPPP